MKLNFSGPFSNFWPTVNSPKNREIEFQTKFFLIQKILTKFIMSLFDDMPASPKDDITSLNLIQDWIQETPHLTELVEENLNVCCPWIICATVGFVIGMGGYLVLNRFRTRTEPEVPLGIRNKIMNWFQDFIAGIRRGYNSQI